MEPRIAFCTHLTSSYEEAAKMAAKNGLLGIEHSFTAETTPLLGAETKRIKNIMGEDCEIRYHAVFRGDDIADPDIKKARKSQARFLEAVRAVGDIGGWFLTIHLGMDDKGDQDRISDHASSNLKELVEAGNESGVMICVENLRFGLTSDPQRLKSIADFAESGVTLDLGHAAGPSGIEGNPQGVAEAMRTLASFIVNAHVYGTEDKKGHEPPRSLDSLEPVLSELMDTDCDWWTIELGRPDDMKRTYSYVRECLNRLEAGDRK